MSSTCVAEIGSRGPICTNGGLSGAISVDHIGLRHCLVEIMQLPLYIANVDAVMQLRS